MNIPTSGNSSSLKVKDEDLRKTVQGSKLVNIKLSQDETAKIAGISKSSVGHAKKQMIDDFSSKESLTPDDDKRFILERAIEVGIEHVLNEEKEPTLENAFGVLLGTYLKVETTVLDNVDNVQTVWTIGRHVTNVYKFISRYKKKNSVSIDSESQSPKYLLKDKNILKELFIRSDDYLENKYYKRWTPTELLIEYIKISNNKLLDIISTNPHILKPILSASYMSPSTDAKTDIKKSYLKGFKIRQYNIYPKLLINIDDLRQFEINSVFSLLVRTVEITKDRIHIPIRHESTKSEEYLGRNYNVFCSLRSKERLQLGFISYDMNAALQSISLQLIKCTRDEYPMLWDYVYKPGYKKQIRTEIANDLNIPVDDVKAKLTAFAHGSTKGIKKHKYYKIFQEESDRLRRVVLQHVSVHAPKVLERAIEQSSRGMLEEIDFSDMEREETPKEMRDNASRFFFVWTWYEGIIREAMTHALADNGASEVIPVHDAVYSRKDIDPEILEKAILAETRYTIKIEQEKL